MYLLETFQDLYWIYSVTDKGLEMLYNSKGYDLYPVWTWQEIIDFVSDNVQSKHTWTVLTKQEYFIESI